MTEKLKYNISLIAIAIILFMGIETKHLNALGDYLLESIGLNAYSNGDKGVHYTAVIVVVLVIMIGAYMKKIEFRYQFRVIFVIIIGCMVLFTYTTDSIAELVKGNTDGINAIGINSDASWAEYSTNRDGLDRFTAAVELINYSHNTIDFQIEIVNSFDDTAETIKILNSSGEEATFRLTDKEIKMFEITDSQYIIEGVYGKDGTSYSAFGINVIVRDATGNELLLSDDKFRGLKVNN